ncbi:MAG: cold shock domain-containing protein [Alphaproteobacteria bacterium]|nr:cold shock domain-containing protein [Alphaproteobacteria bacterium]
MSRDHDHRGPRRRGFDDDDFTPRDKGGNRRSGPSSPPMGLGGGLSGSNTMGGGGGGFQREAPAGGPPVEAVVKWFNGEKGFGFVELGNGSGDAFLHIGVLQNSGREAVPPGAKMKVTVGQGAKGPQVVSVIEVDESTAVAQTSRPAGPRGPRPARAQVDVANATEVAGTVKWFSPDKGYGFVATSDGAKDVFVHVSVLEKAGLTGVNESQKVSMRVVETAKGREAVSIAIAE